MDLYAESTFRSHENTMVLLLASFLAVRGPFAEQALCFVNAMCLFFDNRCSFSSKREIKAHAESSKGDN